MAAINTTKPAPAAAAARGKAKGATATMDSSATPHDRNSTSIGGNNVYQSALDTLAPLEPMLAGFARRNKNQHRRARWWASFSMLRRGASKLLIELVAAAKSRAARHLITTAGSAPIVAGGGGGGSSTSKKSKKSSSSLSGQYEDQHLLDAADQRAAWLRDAIAPKCWIQFGQLTADPQFAGLGVVLLGSLAQVDQVCCALVGQRPVPEVVKAGVQAATAGVTGTTRFGVDDYHGGESGGGGGQRKTDGSRMLPEADEGRKIARPAALSTDDIAGRAITRTSMVPSRGGAGEPGRGGFLKREEATARSDSKGKTTGSLPSSGQISPPSSSLSMPPSIRQDKKSGNQHDESNQEKESNDSTIHKALKRKRDALRTSVPLMVPTMSSNPMMVGHNKQGQDNKDNSGAVSRDELEVNMILRDSASSPESSRQEHTPFAAFPRARKPKQEEQGEHTTGVQIGYDPPRKKKPKKTLDSEEDIGSGDKQKKKKKRRRKGGGDEFDSLFSSLF